MDGWIDGRIDGRSGFVCFLGHPCTTHMNPDVSENISYTSAFPARKNNY